ncbi:MAG: long-chain fatty acid--CoA ligase [Rhodospirillales bacterium]|nr:long-chain fatty acid--CoA ligase [Rhodospirillales bacterium]
MGHLWEKSYPAGVSWGQELSTYPLPQLLDEAVEKWPDQVALDFMDKTMTYRELNQVVNQAAKGFQVLGVKPGVHVGLFLPNTPHYVIAYFGVMRAGGSVVNYSPLDAERELVHKITDSETHIMVTLDLVALYANMEKVLHQTDLQKVIIGNLQEMLPFPKNLLYPLVKRKDIASVPKNDGLHMPFKALLANDGNYTPYPIENLEDSLAVIQYTGGTTGLPKGAMLSHANLSAAVSQYRVMSDGDEKTLRDGEETLMVVLPLFHVFAMTVLMLLGMAGGSRMILHPRFDGDAVIRDIDKKKVTVFPGVPTMFMAIASNPKVGEHDLTSLRFCASGGAPLPAEVQDRFEEISGVRLLEGWGMTETSPSGTSNPVGGEKVRGSCGLPYPGIEIKIVDVDNHQKEMPVGETGEILIKGPNVTRGYWKKPEADREAFVDGFFRTGDTGYLNEDGYMFIVDRTKDMILSSGFNVYPRNIEEAIYEREGVDEVTVIGIPDQYRGQSAKAFIKLKEGASEFTIDELKEFLNDKLAKYEIPTELEFRAELPKTLVGKLTKKELVEEELAKRAAQEKAES